MHHFKFKYVIRFINTYKEKIGLKIQNCEPQKIKNKLSQVPQNQNLPEPTSLE